MKRKTTWKKELQNARELAPNILLGICLFLLIGANLLFPMMERRGAWKADWTREGIYTLSDQTKHLLQELEEDIYIYTVYSPGNEDARLQALLEKYRAASPYVHFSSFSTGMLPTAADMTALSSVKEGVIFANADQSVFRTFAYEDFYLTDETGVQIGWKGEAKITAAIQGIVRGAFCNVRLLSGHGETKQSDLKGFLQLLDIGNFQVADYDFSTATQPLQADTDLLIAISPKADLEHSEYEEISRFMKEGGRILLLLDRASFNTSQGVLQVYTTELPLFSQLLADYGMQVNDDLLLSQDIDAINLRRTSFRATPLRHPITQQLREQKMGVVVHEAASLRFLEQSGVTVSALLSADAHCYAKQLQSDMQNFVFQEGDEQGTFVIAALANKEDSYLAVVTDSLCIGEEALSIPGNQQFFENLINELSPMAPPTSIESKELSIPAIQNTSGRVKMLILSGAYLALPFAILYVSMRTRAGKWRK